MIICILHYDYFWQFPVECTSEICLVYITLPTSLIDHHVKCNLVHMEERRSSIGRVRNMDIEKKTSHLFFRCVAKLPHAVSVVSLTVSTCATGEAVLSMPATEGAK